MRAATQETGKGDSHQLAQVECPRFFKVGVGCGFPHADSCLQGAEPSSHSPIGGMSVSPAVGSLGRSTAANDNAELPCASCHTLDAPSVLPVSLPADREPRSPRAQDLVQGLGSSLNLHTLEDTLPEGCLDSIPVYPKAPDLSVAMTHDGPVGKFGLSF